MATWRLSSAAIGVTLRGTTEATCVKLAKAGISVCSHGSELQRQMNAGQGSTACLPVRKKNKEKIA
jgi:hypothetical protein